MSFQQELLGTHCKDQSENLCVVKAVHLGLVWAINRLHNIGIEIETAMKRGYTEVTKDDLRPITTLLHDLWHNYIGRQANGMHWIMGSSASNIIMDEEQGLWAIAIRHHCEKYKKEEPDEEDDSDYRPPFDPFDGYISVVILALMIVLFVRFLRYTHGASRLSTICGATVTSSSTIFPIWTRAPVRSWDDAFMFSPTTPLMLGHMS